MHCGCVMSNTGSCRRADRPLSVLNNFNPSTDTPLSRKRATSPKQLHAAPTILAVDIHLGHQRECDAVVALGKGLDVGVGARLLSAKLVALRTSTSSSGGSSNSGARSDM
jgi:hypothetical protein